MNSSPEDFIDNVRRGDDGVWRPTTLSEVSYPDDGHDSCHGIEDGSFWFLHRNRCIAAVINHHPPRIDMPFADVGGGNGFVAAMIKQLGYRVVLIEPGASGVRHANERVLDELVQASIVDLSIRPKSLGAIGMFDVIEHIERDSDALRALRDMLVEGGKLYATVPAHNWLWSSVDVEAGHFRRYSAQRLKRLFTDCGFEVDFCSYYFWPLPPPMFLMRTLPEWLRLRRGGRGRQQRLSSEHRGTGGLLDRLLSVEVERFGRGLSVPFGASCILAARRSSGVA